MTDKAPAPTPLSADEEAVLASVTAYRSPDDAEPMVPLSEVRRIIRPWLDAAREPAGRDAAHTFTSPDGRTHCRCGLPAVAALADPASGGETGPFGVRVVPAGSGLAGFEGAPGDRAEGLDAADIEAGAAVLLRAGLFKDEERARDFTVYFLLTAMTGQRFDVDNEYLTAAQRRMAARLTPDRTPTEEERHGHPR